MIMIMMMTRRRTCRRQRRCSRRGSEGRASRWHIENETEEAGGARMHRNVKY